jgi:hypothetical protein
VANSDERLAELFAALLSEITKNLAHEIHAIYKENSKQWGLYASPAGKGLFGFVATRVRSDKYHPDCPLPHLVVFVNKDWADDAHVTPDNKQERGWVKGIGDQASWCVPQNHQKLREVASHLAKIYRVSPAQQEWLDK